MREVSDEPLATSGISSACYEYLSFSFIIIALVQRVCFGTGALTNMQLVKIHCSSISFGFLIGWFLTTSWRSLLCLVIVLPGEWVVSSLELFFIDVVFEVRQACCTEMILFY